MQASSLTSMSEIGTPPLHLMLPLAESPVLSHTATVDDRDRDGGVSSDSPSESPRVPFVEIDGTGPHVRDPIFRGTTRKVRAAKVRDNALRGKARPRRKPQSPDSLDRAQVEALLTILSTRELSNSRKDAIRKHYTGRMPSCGGRCLAMLIDHAVNYEKLAPPNRSAESARASAVRPHGTGVQTQQTLFLSELFDLHGNCVYCVRCVKAIFGVGGSRMSSISSHINRTGKGIRHELVAKIDLMQQHWRLDSIVVPKEIPAGGTVAWWVGLAPDQMVEARMIPFVHGLKGKPSNRHRKLVETQKQFIEFFRSNSTPSGRTGKGTAEFYLDDRFSSWLPTQAQSKPNNDVGATATDAQHVPATAEGDLMTAEDENARESAGEDDDDVVESDEETDNDTTDNGRERVMDTEEYNARPALRREDHDIDPIEDDEEENNDEEDDHDDLHLSVISVFNECMRDRELPEVSCRTFVRWKALYCPKYRLSPHRLDYCDTCKELTIARRSCHATLKRLMDTGGTARSKMEEITEKLEKVRNDRKEHRAAALKERTAYNEAVKCSQVRYKTIEEKERRGEDATKEKEEFVAVISTDFMQERLLPAFNGTAQPGSTYYRMKFVVHVNGIRLEHIEEQKAGSAVYLTDESQTGPKTGDHVITYLRHLFDEVLPSWIQHVEVWTDNASTLKSKYLTTFLNNEVARKRFKWVHERHMLAGHTKFSPDRLFAAIGRAFRRRDVYTVRQLEDVCGGYAHGVRNVSFEDMRLWCEAIDAGTSGTVKVKDLREMRSIQFVLQGNMVKLIAARSNASDASQSSSIIVRDIATFTPLQPATIAQPRGVNSSKMHDLQLTYDQFIPNEHRLHILPPRSSDNIAASVPGRKRPNRNDEKSSKKKSKEGTRMSIPDVA